MFALMVQMFIALLIVIALIVIADAFKKVWTLFKRQLNVRRHQAILNDMRPPTPS